MTETKLTLPETQVDPQQHALEQPASTTTAKSSARGSGKTTKGKAKASPRPSRRAEENVPDRHYLQQMTKLGPREGESLIAYCKRMAAVREGRKLWMSTWKQFGGQREECARALGVPRNNIAYELRMVGLSTFILDRMLRQNNWEDV